MDNNQESVVGLQFKTIGFMRRTTNNASAIVGMTKLLPPIADTLREAKDEFKSRIEKIKKDLNGLKDFLKTLDVPDKDKLIYNVEDVLSDLKKCEEDFNNFLADASNPDKAYLAHSSCQDAFISADAATHIIIAHILHFLKEKKKEE